MPRASRSRPPRTVGLDKPCAKCGRPVSYLYKGPVEGVCGRCSDSRRRTPTRAHAHGIVVDRRRAGRRGRSNLVAVIALLLVVGAAGVALLLDFLVK